MICRNCQSRNLSLALDLGFQPPSNSYMTLQNLRAAHQYFPLRVNFCNDCGLLQTEDFANRELMFDEDYAYLSSTSSSWLKHAADYVEKVVDRFQLDSESFVVELASNDGYLLQNFVDLGIPCLGIEPTKSTATAARAKGVPTVEEFFDTTLGKKVATENTPADLVIGNNVYAHVPDINDFTRGIKNLLGPSGVVTLEFPHAVNLVLENQFDTIYHEHFSYLTLTVVHSIFERHGLKIFDVERLPTHGGSLRIFGAHMESYFGVENSVSELLSYENNIGVSSANFYSSMQGVSEKIKDTIVKFLIEQKEKGNRVIGYGAAAKGNTLLNYAGIKPDLLPYVVDNAPLKQKKYMPGSGIPIVPSEELRDDNVDVILILPWNLRSEIKSQVAREMNYKGKFVIAVPSLEYV